jgi:glycosyltransferase involved in cell wall biosynthesis
MGTPKVSVIIPVYGGADFLGATIQSVFEQTYPNFELIVVDDASPDHTAEVVKHFDDNRLKYIVHERNRGSSAARTTGLRASSGEVIAFLDQDDLLHPEKLRAHVALLEQQPDIGFTYNARFEFNYSSTTIRDLWRPPRSMALADLVLWFPLSPSDVVLRRKWALQLDLIDSGLSWCGGEIYHFSNLFMAGCRFASVDRALNYRRYHSGRIIRDLAGGCESELLAQAKVLADPRCPPEVVALRDAAHSNIYTFWAYRAFNQDETALGQEFLRHAVRHKPSLVEGMPCELVSHLLINCIDDESLNHETRLHRMFAQLPPELAGLADQYSWAAAQGYLLKGARAVIWDRPEDGRRHFEQAAKLGARINDFFLSTLTHKLLDYEAEFGTEAAQDTLHALAPYLQNLGGRASVRSLEGSYLVNCAFEHYHDGEYASAQRMAARAIAKDPKYLVNRGVLAVLSRSILKKFLNRRF